MKRYPAYKDSGVEWLGEVPVSWQVSPLKRACTFFTGWTPPTGNADDYVGENLWANISDLGERTLTNTGKRLSEAAIQRHGIRKVAAGSLLFSFKLSIGSISFAGTDLYTNEAIAAFPQQVGISLNFAYYAFPLMIIRNAGENIYGAKILNQELIRTATLALPPLPEQHIIADFLDRETAKIDALVEEQRRLIALLAEKRQAVISHAVTKGLNPDAPLKPSGIDWLGDIPEGWEVVRLGALFYDIAEAGTDDLPILSVSIHSGVSDDEVAEGDMDRKVTRSEDKSKYIAVRPGDLTYNMMRAWQGGFGAVQVQGMVSPAYVVARPRDPNRQVTEFIELLLRTPNAVVEMKRYSRGVTDFRLRLYWDEFKTICVALPSSAEQQAILSKIGNDIGKFDALTEAATSAIGLLQERRAALISAAVTGKIDLRDEAALVQESA